MECRMNDLVKCYANTLDWILTQQHGPNIRALITGYKASRDQLKSEGYPVDVLKLLVKTKVTNSFYRKVRNPDQFEADWSRF